MTISTAAISRLAKKHPHSAQVLKAFVPLLQMQDTLAEELPAPELPALDAAAFALGKAWLPAIEADPALYFDDAFLKTAPKKLASAAAKGLPDLKESLRALGTFLSKNPEQCRELATLQLRGKQSKIKAWAKKHAQDDNASALLALHLAAAAGRRIERAASKIVLPHWERPYCPICGSRPHGSCIKGKEGKRYLHCSLCRHEWLFPRTVCPACGQDKPQDILLYYLEGSQMERAEVCKLCKHYILSVDMKELTGETPLELYLLCMMPLDVLMQEESYVPLVYAGQDSGS